MEAYFSLTHENRFFLSECVRMRGIGSLWLLFVASVIAFSVSPLKSGTSAAGLHLEQLKALVEVDAEVSQLPTTSGNLLSNLIRAI